MITERIGHPGAWTVELSKDTPQEVLDAVSIQKAGLAHLVITPTRISPSDFSDSAMLSASIYTGVYTRRAGTVLSGSGLIAWLGDESGRGDVLSTAASSSSFTGWMGALRPSYFTAGTVTSIAGSLSKQYQWVTRRAALDEVCAYFNAEYRIRPNFTFDAGPWTSLYSETPRAVVVRRRSDAGSDTDLYGVVGDLEVTEDVEDWCRSVIYRFDSNTQFHEPNGGVSAANVPYRNPTGGAAVVRRVVESSTAATGEAAALAAAEYTAVKSPRQELRLSMGDYDSHGDVAVGDNLFVFDPERGLVGTEQAQFRGETILPVRIRCVGRTWPVRRGMGVYLRRYIGSGVWSVEWIDLTEYVEWETGDGQVEVGALPRPSSSTAKTVQAVSSTVSTVVDRLGGRQVTNFNDATEVGSYWGNNATNTPATGLVVVQVERADNRIVQTAHAATTTADDINRVYRRAWNGTSWTAWIVDEPSNDTGWVDLSSYFLDGAVVARRSGNNAVIRGTSETDITMGTGFTDITSTAIPAAWRPAATNLGSAYAQGASMTAVIRPAGTIAISNRNAINITGQIHFSISYMLG